MGLGKSEGRQAHTYTQISSAAALLPQTPQSNSFFLTETLSPTYSYPDYIISAFRVKNTQKISITKDQLSHSQSISQVSEELILSLFTFSKKPGYFLQLHWL